jgi:hypothetical protein
MKAILHCLCRALCLFALIVIFDTGSTKAQESKFEYGFTYGPSNFLGDLGGNSGKGAAFLKDNMVSLTKFMTGFNIAYRPAEFINFRLSINMGKVQGADSLITGKGGMEEARNTRRIHRGRNLPYRII